MDEKIKHQGYPHLRSFQVCLIIFGFAISIINANVLLQQNFNGSWSTQSPPPGWTIYYTTPVGNSDWHRRNAGQSPWSDNLTPYACLYSTPQETGEDILTSPTINCSAYTNVVLRCSTYFIPQEGQAYTAKLLGSSNGGSSWIELYNYFGQNYGPGLQVFDCPWANNNPNVKFRWYWSGNTNQIYHWSVDNITVTADPIILDVGVIRIVEPTGTVDSGTVISPKAWVKNFGNASVTFPVKFKIGNFYDDIQSASLNPNESTLVIFNTWNVIQVGTHLTKCSTALAGDANFNNDTLTGSVTVQVRDVGVKEIIAPSGELDSTASITPKVLVQNFGTNTETFNVFFHIGDSYFDTKTKTLGPGMEDTVSFANWIPTRGTYSTGCSTNLAGDLNPNNDTISGTVTIRVLDVGVVEILAPTGIIDSGTTITPQVRVENFGTDPVVFPITLEIGSWQETRYKTLSIGQIDTVNFPQWTAQPPGIFTVLCHTNLVGDLVSHNDTLYDSVLVRVLDVGVAHIVAPAQIIRPETIIPQAWLKNYGTTTSGPFTVKFEIIPGYTDIQNVLNLNVGESLLVSFTPWADTCGIYVVKCSTALIGDCNKNNDYKSGNVLVSITGSNPGSWVELPKTIPGSKPLKDGSCLEVIQDTLVFLIKGNKTREFYRLNTKRDTWSKLADVPAGPNNKPVKKGAKMVGDGTRYIYLAKGGNTLEFYRYDMAKDSWAALPDIPLGTGKKIKDGTGIAYCEKLGEPFIYLLKGVNTQEFYRFRILADSWEKMPDAPAGKQKPGYKKGSDLACDNENKIIYCLKDRTNEIFTYDVNHDTWLTKNFTPMPLIHPLYGKKKKVKEGGALCLVSPENIYALKGGNTCEFWLFQPQTTDSGKWLPLALIPAIGADGKKRRVKAGGDLIAVTYQDQNAILAIKGNKTDRIWKWSDSLFATNLNHLESASGGNNFEPSKAKSATENLKPLEISIRPNPVGQNLFIQLPLSFWEALNQNQNPNLKITVALYNPVGQKCLCREFRCEASHSTSPTIVIDTKQVKTGIYLLRVNLGSLSLTRKIIISH
ncbi:MAG: T9SS type A sorting domain-containing protein [candidate division WOR-3 bacterium]